MDANGHKPAARSLTSVCGVRFFTTPCSYWFFAYPHLMTHSVRTLLVGLLIVLGGALPAWGQSSGDGSIYSRFGLGEIQPFASSQAETMGGPGVALRSLNYTNFSNPALWSDQVLTRASFGARYRTLESTSGTDEPDSRLTAGTFEGLQFSFPLQDQKLGVAFGFAPTTRSDFRALSSGSFDPGTSGGDPIDYNVEFEGRGGLQTITGGFGYRINSALSVGASLDYIFGTIETRRSTTFEAGGLEDAVVTEGIRLTALTSTLGAHLTFSDALRDDDNFMIGAAFTLPTELSGEQTRTLGESLDQDTLSTSSEGALDMPWTAKVGFAYSPSSALTLTADGVYAPWSSASSTIGSSSGRPFPVGGTDTFNDRVRVSSGLEWTPAGDDTMRGYLSRVAYRLGVSYEQLYVSPNASTTIEAVEARIGISLPTAASGTRIDLSANVGQQGTTSQGLVQDTYYGVSARVSIGERWFQQRRLR